MLGKFSNSILFENEGFQLKDSFVSTRFPFVCVIMLRNTVYLIKIQDDVRGFVFVAVLHVVIGGEGVEHL